VGVLRSTDFYLFLQRDSELNLCWSSRRTHSYRARRYARYSVQRSGFERGRVDALSPDVPSMLHIDQLLYMNHSPFCVTDKYFSVPIHTFHPSQSRRGLKVLVGEFPVDNVPPSFDVFGSDVAVVHIISVFPNVASEQRSSEIVP
jgi:hypothetical protein